MNRQVSRAMGALGAVVAAALAAVVVALVLLVTSGVMLALAVGVPLLIAAVAVAGLLFGKAELRIVRGNAHSR